MNTPVPAAPADASTASAPDPDWWRDAVVYQIYPRSFADADGNGIGDLAGITDRAPYLASLGIDAVWLSPFYPSALADGGYDVDDYRDVAPEIGTLEDFDRMVAALAAHGIRVIVDIVPNHTSNRHAWFRAALAGGPDAPERALYHVRPGTGEGGAQPPNDWMSMFGGSAWERIEDIGPDGRPLTGPAAPRPYQWYLHMFAPEQPDLNWDQPQVRADFLTTLRFWADRGVAGFRVDVAPGLAKDLTEPFRAFEHIPWWPLPADGSHPLFDRDAVHAIYRDWRAVLDSYDPPRFAVAEAGVWPSRRAAYAASLGQAFNFQLQDADLTPASFRWAIEAGLADLATTGSTTWVLGCHDTPRVATRLGFDLAADDAPEDSDPDYLGGVSQRIARRWLMNDGAAPACDASLGRRRARAAAMVEMALPGSMYIYQGDELGLPEVPDIPEDRLADPIAHRMRDKEKGRDGCRVPLPWTAEGSSHGFGPDGAAAPHLPQPAGWGAFAVEAQEAREADGERNPEAAPPAPPPGRAPAAAAVSMLALYRAGLALRRSAWARADREVRWLETGPGALAFARGDLQCWVAFEEPVALPVGDVLLASAPLGAPVVPAAPDARDGADEQVVLPAGAAAWIRVPS
ncbi:alpha amylase, catalytic domain protein [Actinomyces sp. Chiba101]|uniref:glycoside hydrolase family 13 protein n=1 Tax=Actinomyces TaxID=1654 RepID=UPI000974E0BE|nr:MULTISPECIES: glycoside hydrolase family 13 protein [Actinomyces]BAW94162.1 alpha amylase, catalytic domain protein [Actinomyces sp. Chiba101]SUU13544.1 Oligo-1,6-glucosidase [Actinomyces denticolens]